MSLMHPRLEDTLSVRKSSSRLSLDSWIARPSLSSHPYLWAVSTNLSDIVTSKSNLECQRKHWPTAYKKDANRYPNRRACKMASWLNPPWCEVPSPTKGISTPFLRVTEEELAMSNDMTLLLLKDPSSRVQSSYH